MPMEWVEAIHGVSPAELTVRAQALNPQDVDNLVWPQIMPRRAVRGMRVSDLPAIDFRPASDRREWNARGRLIPIIVPGRRDMEFVPIESYYIYDERAMQELRTGLSGDQRLIMQQLAADIPDRVDVMVAANYRRVELDCIQAWTTGTITVRNPQDASKTYTASYGIDPSRIQTAGTSWSGVPSAYDTFVSWYNDAVQASGPGAGVMLRQARLNEILADAPTQIGGARMSLVNLEQRLSDDLGMPFTFFVNENSIDVFTDGGTAYTRTKEFPLEIVAFVPQGGAVGYTGFAPVLRAMDVAAQVPEAHIDVNSVAVFYEGENGSRSLRVECQLNAFPVPDEGRVYVIDVVV